MSAIVNNTYFIGSHRILVSTYNSFIFKWEKHYKKNTHDNFDKFGLIIYVIGITDKSHQLPLFIVRFCSCLRLYWCWLVLLCLSSCFNATQSGGDRLLVHNSHQFLWYWTTWLKEWMNSTSILNSRGLCFSFKKPLNGCNRGGYKR